MNKTEKESGDTRQRILQAACDTFAQKGFRDTTVAKICSAARANVAAVNYYFGSKQGLGYAVVEERVKPLVRERYLDTFRAVADPIEGLKRMGARMQQELEREGILLMGCPVNNLVTEMSGVDEGFRRRLAGILDEWKATIAEGLRRGQASGLVRSDVDAEAVATFYVASYQGACGFAKNAHDISPFEACRSGLDNHLESLRPKERQ